MNSVREHIENGKVVLDNDDRAGHCKVTDELCSRDPLVNVQEWRDLIEKVEVGIPGEAGGDCHPLKFPAAQGADLVVEDGIELEDRQDPGECVPFVRRYQEGPDRPGENLRDIIDILGLGRDLQRLFRYGLEIIEEARCRYTSSGSLPMQLRYRNFPGWGGAGRTGS